MTSGTPLKTTASPASTSRSPICLSHWTPRHDEQRSNDEVADMQHRNEIRAACACQHYFEDRDNPHMSTPQSFVIVGAGLAGAKAAEALRANGFGGQVILIGDEAERPYDRPPLSKGFLLGSTERKKIYIHPAQWHLEHDIDLRLGTQITEINRAAH